MLRIILSGCYCIVKTCVKCNIALGVKYFVFTCLMERLILDRLQWLRNYWKLGQRTINLNLKTINHIKINCAADYSKGCYEQIRSLIKDHFSDEFFTLCGYITPYVGKPSPHSITTTTACLTN